MKIGLRTESNQLAQTNLDIGFDLRLTLFTQLLG